MGCVYFIKHRGMDPIKIGMSNSNNPYDRLKDFETTSPFGIELLGFIKTDEPDKLEKNTILNLVPHTLKENGILSRWKKLTQY